MLSDARIFNLRAGVLNRRWPVVNDTNFKMRDWLCQRSAASKANPDLDSADGPVQIG